MKRYSSREAAKKLGLHLGTLQKYIAEGRIPVPSLLEVGQGKLRIWTDDDIARVREALPKIANGRKTRYQELRNEQKPQPGAAVPQRSRKQKKK